MIQIASHYISAGGNRHPSAADWDIDTGLVAFGSDQNVALWSPLDSASNGIQALLRGHIGTVNAVKFLPDRENRQTVLLSGSVDKSIRIWLKNGLEKSTFKEAAVLEGHSGSINCLAIFRNLDIFASGSADGTVRIWKLTINATVVITELVQVIQLSPRMIPLALALVVLDQVNDIILAVAGTQNYVKVFVAPGGDSFAVQATLAGHEGWVRSLAFCPDHLHPEKGILLASASQDKYIRLWRIKIVSKDNEPTDDLLGTLVGPLSNKAYKLTGTSNAYSLTFEALLLGHDDWIYNISWSVVNEKPRLLSASEDSSLAIWERDEDHDVWVSKARLGDISGLKGSTTATGSAGGFWVGLWGPCGSSIVSIGRTGGWRLWRFHEDDQNWVQEPGISGHCKSLTSLAWSENGSFLFSTGSDQTTRLHAEWIKPTGISWHEMARPQVHGYDLNCIACVGKTQFISGADEKLLRVFDEPQASALLLQQMSGVKIDSQHKLPLGATMPVLGLSNKAADIADIEPSGADEMETLSAIEKVPPKSNKIAFPSSPPGEDQLGRHTLWPEREKLYGHGYEISAVAATHDGKIVATSCKASSIDYAVIRLYTTDEWREVKPSLMAHSLTVTAIKFSADDDLLLSVGRDRQWAIWKRHKQQPSTYDLARSNPKGHSRMILDACWLPRARGTGAAFATAGRDKCVKIWSHAAESTSCVATLATESPVTAVDGAIESPLNEKLLLAVGLENGAVSIYIVRQGTWEVSYTYELDRSLQPSRAITQLAWRPSHVFEKASSSTPDDEVVHDSNGERSKDDSDDNRQLIHRDGDENKDSDRYEGESAEDEMRRTKEEISHSKRGMQLAVSSEDGSLRLFGVSLSRPIKQ